MTKEISYYDLAMNFEGKAISYVQDIEDSKNAQKIDDFKYLWELEESNSKEKGIVKRL